jgi:hypothetical protein
VRQPVSSLCALILSFALGVATTLQVQTLCGSSQSGDARLPPLPSIADAESVLGGAPCNCRAFLVAVDGRGAISVNDERLGSLDDTALLVERLKELLSAREASGVERQGVGYCRDVPAGLPIERAVRVRAPRTLPYGDLAILLDAVEIAGAESIKLSLEEDAQDF